MPRGVPLFSVGKETITGLSYLKATAFAKDDISSATGSRRIIFSPKEAKANEFPSVKTADDAVSKRFSETD